MCCSARYWKITQPKDTAATNKVKSQVRTKKNKINKKLNNFFCKIRFLVHPVPAKQTACNRKRIIIIIIIMTNHVFTYQVFTYRWHLFDRTWSVVFGTASTTDRRHQFSRGRLGINRQWPSRTQVLDIQGEPDLQCRV